MSQPTKSIDPIHLAETGAKLSGALPLNVMERLSQILLQDKGEVKYEINFTKDTHGLPILYGKIHTVLQLQCQRCMQEMSYKVETELHLSPVISDIDIEQLPQGYEPLVVAEGNILLETIIEDEILLNVPIVPKHELNECQVKITVPSKKELKAPRDNPFKILGKLKLNKH